MSAWTAESLRTMGLPCWITGGRAVLHHQELTYSIVSRTDNTFFPQDVLGTYKVIAAGLLAGLRNLGIEAEMADRVLASAAAPSTPPAPPPRPWSG